VDNHWGMLFEAAILTTFLSIGSEAGANNNENALVQASLVVSTST
jgi:type IV secretion system protein TrbI